MSFRLQVDGWTDDVIDQEIVITRTRAHADQVSLARWRDVSTNPLKHQDCFNHTTPLHERFQCKTCQRYCTPQPKPQGYSTEQRARALELYLEGNGLRRIARLLKTHHRTIANWVAQHHATLPATPAQPVASAVVELDELYTFVGAKKTEFT